jgi:hypothetical protein
MVLQLPISWDGPYTLREVIKKLTDLGEHPDYDGEDYGLYQIYGKHILGDPKALLYVGSAIEQTFSARFRQHESWLIHEDLVRIYVGRIYSPRRHTARNDWATWKADVLLAERAMIYKYSPHYNSNSITERPLLNAYKKLVLVHSGQRNRLHKRDVVPDDWE